MTENPSEPVALLPCPSGHPAGGRNNNNIYGTWWQQCSQCSWRTAGDTEAEAIAAWNQRTRPTAPASSELVERLEALAAKATPELWESQGTDRDGPEYGTFIIGQNLGGLVGAALPWPTEIEDQDFTRVEANADLIVALRNNLPAILTALRAQGER